jgi:hypothetical protein
VGKKRWNINTRWKNKMEHEINKMAKPDRTWENKDRTRVKPEGTRDKQR